ncbi:MAG: Bug family tripartite tricarboxylate transporter substrate binding protein [Xanthobacteraceae bacterium]
MRALQRPRLAVMLFLFICVLSGSDAWSQSTRTIRIVVPFAPGGGADILARLVAEQIGRAQGPTMVIENRPGAGTVIASEAVARAAPDGSTVLIVANSFVINPNLKKVNYDPLTSFEPVCHLTRSPNVVAVHSTSPFGTLADLVNAARGKPGELTMAFNGPATSQHIGFEKLRRAANVHLTHVPYPGGGPAVNALVGQHVTSLFVNYPSVAEQVKAGRLRALAIASRTRLETLPDLPTIAESGYPDYEEDVWFGSVAPAKTPKETVSQLAAWFAAAVQAPEIKQKLLVQELYPVGTCGADFAAYLRQHYDEYGRVIRDSNIKAE